MVMMVLDYTGTQMVGQLLRWTWIQTRSNSNSNSPTCMRCNWGSDGHLGLFMRWTRSTMLSAGPSADPMADMIQHWHLVVGLYCTIMHGRPMHMETYGECKRTSLLMRYMIHGGDVWTVVTNNCTAWPTYRIKTIPTRCYLNFAPDRPCLLLIFFCKDLV